MCKNKCSVIAVFLGFSSAVVWIWDSVCSADRPPKGDDGEGHAVPAARLSLVTAGKISLMVSVVWG